MRSQLIDDLVEEHRVIEELLGSLLRVAGAASEGGADARPALAEHVRLVRELADAWHHGREEELLFAAMIEAGFPRDAGPVAVMLHEHDEGRASVRALAAIAEGSGPLSADEVERTRANARAFASLLSQHITKEDRILYPMALERLDEEALVELDGASAARVREAGGLRERLFREARELVLRTRGT